jgi:hypothetical protein
MNGLKNLSTNEELGLPKLFHFASREIMEKFH